MGMFGFSPRFAPLKIWLAKILVDFLVAHELANIDKKNELLLPKSYWHAKILATI
jgi:hypothetical protein